MLHSLQWHWPTSEFPNFPNQHAPDMHWLPEVHSAPNRKDPVGGRVGRGVMGSFVGLGVGAPDFMGGPDVGSVVG